MKYLLLVLLFLFGFSPVSAASGVGEGYAPINFRELSQSLLMLGGLDIKDPVVIDEYARLVYCDQYKANFKNDFEWNKARSQIAARVTEKKEYFRVFFQTSDVFNLDRYDSASQSFPLTPDTAMKNVGSMLLTTPREGYQRYCDIASFSEVFAPTVALSLVMPVTVDSIKMPQAEAEKLLARMTAEGNPDRQIYGRIRFQVSSGRKVVDSTGHAQRSELMGEVTAIDFFLDSELSKPLPGAAAVK